MQRSVVLLGALAAFLGGLAWVLRGTWVLITGETPSLIFGIGPVFFVLALAGLAAAVPNVTIQTHVAIVITIIAATLYIAATVLHFAVDEATAEGPLRAGATILMVLALIVIGRPIKRQRALPPPWHHLPFWLGLMLFPAFVVFALIGGWLDDDLADRILEVPVVLFGIGWTLIGNALWRTGAHRPPPADGPLA